MLIARVLSAGDRIYEILNASSEICDAPNTAALKIAGEVRFDSVCFEYEPGIEVLHQIIRHMDKGYDAEVQSRGTRLSLGPHQLISFARATLADLRIRILGEAISKIDSYTRALIRRAVGILLRGRAVFSLRAVRRQSAMLIAPLSWNMGVSSREGGAMNCSPAAVCLANSMPRVSLAFPRKHRVPMLWLG